MLQDDKELLLKDLCARLPYGVKCEVLTHPNCRLPNWKKEDDLYYKGRPKYQTLDLATLSVNPIECFKPYLRPMSSMTEEEKEYLRKNCRFYFDDCSDGITNGIYSNQFNRTIYEAVDESDILDIIDWLNSHHFDYHGLIEKGLALEAPEGMYKFE